MRARRVAGVLALLAVAAGLLWWNQWHVRQQERGLLEPSGGVYFPRRIELAVPSLRQGDERWRTNRFGAAGDTLGAAGCAIACAAMVMKYYGYDTDPGRLAAVLETNGGFVGSGWLVWEKAAEAVGPGVEKAYEDLPSYALMDDQLRQGNPVIVRVRPPMMRTTHFVVIAGKEGFDYLVQDPGRGAGRGLYPLRELGSGIEALRYYRKAPQRGGE
jgi:hypothetical protein